MSEQLDVLQHACGLDPFGRGTWYRNYYVGESATCRALVADGLMMEGRTSDLTGGDPVFHVTEAGKAWIRANSPEPPRLTRSQQRYRTFLRADPGVSFREFMGWGKAGAKALLAAALLLLMPGAAEAQTHADSLRLVARDAFTLLQVELGTGRFTLDETTVTGMSLESVIISASGTTTPAQWEADVRKQLPAKMKALAAKVSRVQVIGVAPIPTTDGVVISDAKRGVALAVKSSLQPGVTGRMSITFAVLVRRVP